MQIKQLSSIINANLLSPWSDELDVDSFLAPPTPSKMKRQKAAFIKYGELTLQQNQKNIEQQAKKTLLDIASEKKHQNKTELKSYINRKSKSYLSHLTNHEDLDVSFKLPPINKVYDSIDYNGYVLPQDVKKGILEEIDLFRKYGDHRKSKLRQGSSKVQRSISFGPMASKDLAENIEKKSKVQTLEPIPLNSIDQAELKKLKLKGKKYSFESRGQSQRKLSSDQYKYIPTQPNITPHKLLFGHSQQDILKKVLQQINQKLK